MRPLRLTQFHHQHYYSLNASWMAQQLILVALTSLLDLSYSVASQPSTLSAGFVEG